MRKRLVCALSSLIVGYLGLPAWAQLPAGQPLPEPTPLPNPTESPAPPPVVTTVVPPDLTGYGQTYNQGCDPCCAKKHGIWSVGGGAYYMTPVFESNPAYIAATGGSFNREDFSHSADIAPLAWIAYTSANGLGIRGRWWMFDGEGNASATLDGATTIFDAGGLLGAGVTPGAGSVVNATSSLKLHVYDLEGIYQWNCGSTTFLASAGGRFVELSQDYLLSINDGGAVASSSGSSSFKGGGPTFSFEVHHPICSSCFSAYGQLRGSLLFGTAVQNGAAVGPDGAVSTASRQVDILPIGEAEVGGEWNRTWGKLRLTAQLGFVGQVWWGGGNAAQGPAGSDVGQNFGFYGGVARLGFNF